jgi:hypothetical protein
MALARAGVMPMTVPSWLAKVQRAPRRLLVAGVALGLVLLVVVGAAFLVDAPLRRYTEAKVNRALKGYTVHIGSLDFHPVGFSLDLRDVVVTQDAHPDPPVADIPLLSASVHWRALLWGRVVGDVVIDRPTIHVDVTQARAEIADPTPIKERGWQDALEAIYPLKLNHFQVTDGDVTYVDRGPFKPLRLRHLSIDATNIRNIKSAEHEYPSPVQLEAAVFDSGRLSARGRADFLAAPNPTFRGDFSVDQIQLDYFKPITTRYNVAVDGGLLSAEGEVESAAETKSVKIRKATVTGIQVDYVHTPETARAEAERERVAGRAIRSVNNAPDVRYRIGELRVSQGTFGFVNRAAARPYRVFLSDVELVVSNLSNQGSEGTSRAHLRGKFMGTGTAVAQATFRAASGGPAFDTSVRIDDVDMPSMNDLLRAYGKFDVAAGRFSFYSELSVRDGAVTGYVKPLFKDLVVYDPRQDRDKSAFRKLYERVVGAVSKALRNSPRAEVATKADVSGRLDDPNVSTIQVIVKVIQNAFFKAILPGFDRETSRLGHEAGAKVD